MLTPADLVVAAPIFSEPSEGEGVGVYVTLTVALTDPDAQSWVFSNVNDGVTMTVDASSLVGNTAATGPAESITIAAPLILSDQQQLLIDTSALLAQAYTLLHALQASIAAVQARL